MLSITRRKPEPTLDRRGYRRSPVTLPSYRQGKPNANRGRKFPPDPLKPDEVFALIAACEDSPTGRRNQAIIRMFWRTGLRCAELIALMPKDVDLEDGRVTVLCGKGGKRRVVAIDPEACGWLREWEIERAELGFTRLQPFFCVIVGPTAGEHVHDAYLREMLRKLRAKVGIERRVACHQFRHAYATFLMEQGMSVHFIQAMLGHSSLAITERYMHLNPAMALREVRKLEWPAAA